MIKTESEYEFHFQTEPFKYTDKYHINNFKYDTSYINFLLDIQCKWQSKEITPEVI